jgi:putative phage-type endonuclease
MREVPQALRHAHGGAKEFFVTYEILPEFVQDSDDWHRARMGGLGASEVAAVLGLSPWQTPLDVYRTKMGVPHEIPEDLSYFGHALEQPIADWVSEKKDLEVHPGFAARSTQWDWLTASPDRMVYVNDDLLVPLELKTSSAYSKDAWASGVPLHYQAQVQAQLAVLGAPYGWLAVLHGGNSPELFRLERDEVFIEQLVRLTGEWWERHVVAKVPPEPVTLAEQAELWSTEPDSEVELSDTAYEVLERRNVLLSDIRAQQAEADLLQAELGRYVEKAERLTYQGRTVATYKTQPGRRTVSVADVEKVAPHLIKTGAPFKVLRTVKEAS